MDFIQKVKNEVKQQGLTLTEFYDAVGISKNTFYNWETGSQIPLKQAVKIINYLHISADEILETDYIKDIQEGKSRAETISELAIEIKNRWIDFCQVITGATNRIGLSDKEKLNLIANLSSNKKEEITIMYGNDLLTIPKAERVRLK